VLLATEFSATVQELAHCCFTESNLLAVIALPDQDGLDDVCRRASAAEIDCGVVDEPDLGGERTAVAFVSSIAVRRLSSNLPLAFRGTAMT
jgi:hypothetical protein